MELNESTLSKIDKLIEEDFKQALRYGMPLAGAAGLGYMGYHSGEDLVDGIQSVSDRNNNFIESGKSMAEELLSGKKPSSNPANEIGKFFTPGKDGSWKDVGEAMGNRELNRDKYIPNESLDSLRGEYRTTGALAGAGLGYGAGKLISPSKRKQ